MRLSPEQTEKITLILNEHIIALGEIRKQARPKIAKQMNELYSDVLAVLDAEQQELWKQSIEGLKEQFSGRRHRGGRGNREGRRGEGPGMEGGFSPEHRPFEFWEEEPERRSRPIGPRENGGPRHRQRRWKE